MMNTIYQYAQMVFVQLGREADGGLEVETETRDLVERRVFCNRGSGLQLESVR